MKKHIDTLSILLGALTLGLMAVAGSVFYREYQKQGGAMPEHPVIPILILIVLVLLFQIVLLLRRARESGGSLIFADLDSDGIPEKIFEVPESTVIHFCRKEFAMIYRIEYWPDLRNRLLAHREENTPERAVTKKQSGKINGKRSNHTKLPYCRFFKIHHRQKTSRTPDYVKQIYPGKWIT